MPYNKKLTDPNRSGSTGKYPTSVSKLLLFFNKKNQVYNDSAVILNGIEVLLI
jgi:hypothetical protein